MFKPVLGVAGRPVMMCVVVTRCLKATRISCVPRGDTEIVWRKEQGNRSGQLVHNITRANHESEIQYIFVASIDLEVDVRSYT